MRHAISAAERAAVALVFAIYLTIGATALVLFWLWLVRPDVPVAERRHSTADVRVGVDLAPARFSLDCDGACADQSARVW